MKRVLLLSFKVLVWIFALVGFFLSASYLAIRLKLTDEKGFADPESRYYSEIRDRYNQGFSEKGDSLEKNDFHFFEQLIWLNRRYPFNAHLLQNAIQLGSPAEDLQRMMDQIEIRLNSDSMYFIEKKKFTNILDNQLIKSKKSVFEWMNIAEWQDFKIAVVKDKKLIDSCAKLSGVEPRLIVSCIVGEQIRLFNSNRESYKKWIGPLKILSVESKFSFGITGVKEHTAMAIERNLKDSLSEYYPGKKFRHLLQFKTGNPSEERITRLTSFRNHYYSYLYTGLFLRQIYTQWEKAGFSLRKRPEILATLFNIGFRNSTPKSNPEVGGALIRIKNNEYSFGSISAQFYHSGELLNEFPYHKDKFP